MSGMPVGRLIGGSSRPPLWRAVSGLFRPGLPSRAAVSQFMQAFLNAPLQPPEVRLNTSVHTLTVAPPGAGKTTSLIVPFLRSCPDNMVIHDPKGEIFQQTSEFRRAIGHKVIALDPWVLVTQKPDTLNPFDFEDPSDAESLDFARDLAESIVQRSARDEPHWPDMAELFIGGAAAAVLNFCPAEECNLLSVCKILADRKLLGDTCYSLRTSPAWGGTLARLGHILTHAGKEELESILSTANRMLRFLSSPSAEASLRTSSFDPGELTKGRMTIYLIVPAHHLRPAAGLIRLWLSTLHRAVIRTGIRQTGLVHMVIDETAVLGHHEAIDDMLSMGRGYGIRVHLFFQNIAQLMKCYPEGQHQTVLGTTTNIFFAARDFATCEEISKRSGNTTVLLESGGESDSISHQRQKGSEAVSVSVSRSRNSNWSFTGMPLMRPEQVAALPERVAITFAPGVGAPILTRLTPYFERRLRPSRRLVAWRSARTLLSAAMLASVSVLLALGVSAPRPPPAAQPGTAWEPMPSATGWNPPPAGVWSVSYGTPPPPEVITTNQNGGSDGTKSGLGRHQEHGGRDR